MDTEKPFVSEVPQTLNLTITILTTKTYSNTYKNLVWGITISC